MILNFEDGSFLSLQEKDDKMTFILCAKKDHNTTVMSASKLDVVQVSEVINFLNDWIKKQEK